MQIMSSTLQKINCALARRYKCSVCFSSYTLVCAQEHNHAMLEDIYQLMDVELERTSFPFKDVKSNFLKRQKV